MSKYKDKILTVPNILSFIRLALIPVIVWLYCFKEKFGAALVVLTSSGVTDLLDGFIARKFDMISDFGKIIDPIADKLTQMAVMFCLSSRYIYMGLPLIILIIKEMFAGITSLITVKKTGRVMSSEWHGKVTTFLLYFTMGIHVIWLNIPALLSRILIYLCTGFMLLSAVLYSIRNLRAVKNQYDIEEIGK